MGFLHYVLQDLVLLFVHHPPQLNLHDVLAATGKASGGGGGVRSEYVESSKLGEYLGESVEALPSKGSR